MMLKLVLIYLTFGLFPVTLEGLADRINPFRGKKIAKAFLINKRVKRSLHEECSEKATCSQEEARENDLGREETCELFKQRKCTERRCGVGYYCDTWNDNGCQRLSQYEVFCGVRKTVSITKSALKPGSDFIHMLTQTKYPKKELEEKTSSASYTVLSFNSIYFDSSSSWLSPSQTEVKSSWLSRNLSVVIAVPIVILVVIVLLTFLWIYHRKKYREKFDDAQNLCKLQSPKTNVQRPANSISDHVYDVVSCEYENQIYQQDDQTRRY